jgi:thiamine kinase-like enzyme
LERNFLSNGETHDTESNLNITIDDIKDNYILKLKNRFNKNDYYFEDAESVFNKLITDLETSFNPVIKKFIHGDFWFSNMILDFRGKLKVFDMKGKVYTTYTTGGDKMYDYAKLYQSILGYDCILNNVSIPQSAQSLRLHFEEKVVKNRIHLDDLKTVTFSLVLGTLHSIDNLETKERVWKWIHATF